MFVVFFVFMDFDFEMILVFNLKFCISINFFKYEFKLFLFFVSFVVFLFIVFFFFVWGNFILKFYYD